MLDRDSITVDLVNGEKRDVLWVLNLPIINYILEIFVILDERGIVFEKSNEANRIFLRDHVVVASFGKQIGLNVGWQLILNIKYLKNVCSKTFDNFGLVPEMENS